MNPKQIMFMGLILAAGTLVSLTFAGGWLTGTEMELQNAVTVFKQANVLNTWSVTVPNVTFLLVGARALIAMDFAFFGGVLQVLQWFLFMTLGLAMMWGLYVVAINTIGNLFPRPR